jgi:hypothetical protein
MSEMVTDSLDVRIRQVNGIKSDAKSNVRTHFEFLFYLHFHFASSNPGIASSAKVSDIMDMGIVERTSSLHALQSFFSQ